MILFDLADYEQTAQAYPQLRTALEWLTHRTKTEFNVHTEELDKGAYANFERNAMVPRERAHLEAHRRYIDIHVPLNNDEAFGWAPVRRCRRILTPYDPERDIEFYGDDAHSMMHVRVGEAVVFFPDDAHGPNIGIGFHKKICIKIPVGQ